LSKQQRILGLALRSSDVFGIFTDLGKILFDFDFPDHVWRDQGMLIEFALLVTMYVILNNI